MQIKWSTKTSAWKMHPIATFFRNARKSAILVFLGLLMLVTGVSLVSVYYGMVLFQSKQASSFDEFFENAVKTKWSIVPNYISGRLSPAPERITIDLKHQHLQNIAYKRHIALDRGILLTSSDDFVPAHVTYGDRTLKVKMRLKGDWTDHLLGEKWSFRIQVKGDNTVMGMKQFSIHHPRTRNYLYEWIYHQALKREGIIGLRYKFVEVTLNGKDLGVYALEEHFEKRLIENNQFREGPIIKFAENLLWEDRAMHHLKGFESPTGLAQETVSAVDVFKTNSVINNPSQYRQFMTATTMIESFRNGELPMHEAFDVNKMATFFALSDLMGAEHSVMWQNLRFYFNPVTSLLEPIGFDANAGRSVIHVVGSNRALEDPVYKFKDLVFGDLVFYEKYVRELVRLSDPTYLDTLFAAIDHELQENLKIVYREFPYFHFTKRVFYDNQKAMIYALNPAKGVHAFFDKSTRDEIELDLGNIHALPIEVLDVTYRDQVQLRPVDRVVLEPKRSERPVDYKRFKFKPPPGFAWEDSMRVSLTVNYRNLGVNQIRRAEVFSWPRRISNLLDTDFMRRPANAEEFDFITINENSKEVYIKPGSWKIDRDLIIGGGYKVIAKAGTTLDLANDAVFLSRSPLDFKGNEEAPIVIQSSDSTGQGLVVIKAEHNSTLEHVHFSNLSNPSKGSWSLTGAVTFYESPVHIRRCRFADNRCEDGLNIVRAEFTIDHAIFKGTESDAFDGDWVKGQITNSLFVASGNDAVDVSGSYLEIENVVVDNAGDKGLSAGEHSEMIVRSAEVVNSEIAVASKDLSKVEIEKIKISNCQVGFTLYQKKPEFGGGTVTVNQLIKNNLKMSHLVEASSKLRINGSHVPANAEHVESILYGVEFGKASRRATN